MQPSPGGKWEQLEEYLGLPLDPDGRRRVAELKAEGWEFVGVFSEWHLVVPSATFPRMIKCSPPRMLLCKRS